MTGKLSDLQMMWLRGLSFGGGWVPLSASELGNAGVSELQSLELVKIQHPTFGPCEWRITDAGRAVVSDEQAREK